MFFGVMSVFLRFFEKNITALLEAVMSERSLVIIVLFPVLRSIRLLPNQEGHSCLVYLQDIVRRHRGLSCRGPRD